MARTRKYLPKLKNRKMQSKNRGMDEDGNAGPMRNTQKTTSKAKKHKLIMVRTGSIDICYIVKNYKTCFRKQVIYGGASPQQTYRPKPVLNTGGFRRNIEKLYEESIIFIEKQKAAIAPIIKEYNSKYTPDHIESIYNSILPYLRNADNKTKTLTEMADKYPANQTTSRYDNLFIELDKAANISITDNKPDKLNTLGHEVIKQLIAPLIFADTIASLKKTITTYKQAHFISDEKADQLLSTFDKPTGTAAATVSKVANLTDKAVNGIMSGALKIGEWFSPVIHTTEKAIQKNNTIVKMFYLPSKHLQYAKGSAIPSKERKYGDLMIYIDDNYANVGQFFSKMTNGVDDLLANVLNGCKDMSCKTGNVTPFPFKITKMVIDETI